MYVGGRSVCRSARCSVEWLSVGRRGGVVECRSVVGCGSECVSARGELEFCWGNLFIS